METAAAPLPDDLLTAVLGRLPAPSLAASRGVSRAWRDLIDERHRFLLPHLVRGLFINYHDYERTHFLSRPTLTLSLEHDSPRRRGRHVDGKFDFIKQGEPYKLYDVVDHCNGLVLFRGKDGNKTLHVCNPTTRWSACLPPCPAFAECFNDAFHWLHRAFLVLDPFVSPEYTVLLSPTEPKKKKMKKAGPRLMKEWPPSEWKGWHEFSSSTGRWEKKVFVREGEAAGRAGDLLLYEHTWSIEPPCRYAVYWMGALYVHWRGEFVSRLSLLDYKYRVIKTPIQPAECKEDGVKTFLGRSEKGVYLAAIASDALVKLRVWTLSESSGQAEWVPKHQSNLKINTYSLENNKFDQPKNWTLDLEPEYSMLNDPNKGKKNEDVSLEQNVCWDSDDDSIMDVSNGIPGSYDIVKFLGFHPYKEVIFLSINSTAVAFHLKSPKVQYLGTVHLGTYNRGLRESFVYTPCLIRDY